MRAKCQEAEGGDVRAVCIGGVQGVGQSPSVNEMYDLAGMQRGDEAVLVPLDPTDKKTNRAERNCNPNGPTCVQPPISNQRVIGHEVASGISNHMVRHEL